jgi:hypothetical protein
MQMYARERRHVSCRENISYFRSSFFVFVSEVLVRDKSEQYEATTPMEILGTVTGTSERSTDECYFSELNLTYADIS